jgi:hypothetical protein
VGFLDEQVDTVYSILYGQQHYVVMETHIPSKTMRIVDGKKYALSIWAPLAKNILILGSFQLQARVPSYGHFQARLMKTTSIAGAYQTEYGGTPLSTGGCGCKTNCQRYCGCRRKNVPCGDGCRCRGNCADLWNTK